MKKKLISLLLGLAVSMQCLCFTVNAEIDMNSIDSIRTITIDVSDDEPAEIELLEGEQVQLEFSGDYENYDDKHIRYSSYNSGVAVSQDMKLIGCTAGKDQITVYFGYDFVKLKVNVKPNENISAENRAELDRINNLGTGGNEYLRRKIELVGAIDEDAPRLNMKKVQEIIDSSASFEEILKRCEMYNSYPDLIPYGRSTTNYIYWFDEKGNEQITFGIEWQSIYYTKIADDGTVIGTQQLYPEKSEFYEYDHSQYKDYDYIEYNQVKPVGYGAVNLSIKDEWSNELLSDDLADFCIVAYPANEISAETATIIESWNPAESNPHTITELSRDMIYEVRYTGDKSGEYWYEINTGNVYFDFFYKDEISITIPVKKHYKGEPVRLIYGDVNNDGAFNVADVLTFQKWLLGVPDAELKVWALADLCSDDVLNVFDLCLMKKELVKSNSDKK